MPFYAIIEPLMYRISLENTTSVDFGRETWMKSNCLKNYSWFYLSDPTFSDLSIEIEDSTKRLPSEGNHSWLTL